MIKDVRYLQYMDQDTDVKLLDPAAVLKKTNLRIHGNEGTMGKNVPLPGTVHIPHDFQPSKVVGWCQDVKNKAIIMFLWRPSGYNDVILRYYIETKQVETILSTHILDLDENSIVEADVVDDLLYWTDGINPMRKINMVKALNFTQGNMGEPGTKRYTSINRQMIMVAKPSPPAPEDVLYDSEDTNRNYLRGSLYQFRAQYIYDDGEESVWSPISEVPLPYGEAAINATYAQGENQNNAIKMDVKNGEQTVKSVRLAYREGNFGNWKTFKTINVFREDGLRDWPANNKRNFTFYGNEVTYGIDQEYAARLFHDVPLRSKKQRFINGTNLVYANYNSGYGNSGVTLDLTPKMEPIEMGALTTFDYGVYELDNSYAFDTAQKIFFNLRLWDTDKWWEYEAGDEIYVKVTYHHTIDGEDYEEITLPIGSFSDDYQGLWQYIKSVFENVVTAEKIQQISDSAYAIDIVSPQLPQGGVSYQQIIKSVVSYVKRDGVEHELHYSIKEMSMPGGGYPDELALPVLDISTVGFENGDTFLMQMTYSKLEGGEWATLSSTFTYNYFKDNPDNVITAIDAFMGNLSFGDSFARIGSLIIFKNDFYITYSTGGDLTGLAFSKSSAVDSEVSSWKSGNDVEVGVVYFDSVGRSGGVQGAESVTIKSLPEIHPDGYFMGSEPFMYHNKIEVIINGSPPEWATSYQVVASPKRKGFFQYFVDELERTDDGRHVKIFLNDAINEGLAVNVNANYGFYDFKEGDRIRFLYFRESGGNYRVIKEPLDLQIIGVGYKDGSENYEKDDSDDTSFIIDQHGNKIRKRTAEYLMVKNFNFEGYWLNRRSLAEVYTPESIDDDNNIFYEVGERYPIDDGQHSQETVILDKGDSYIRTRMRDADKIFICEDPNYSDIYQSNVWGRGRPNIYIEGAKNKDYPNHLKHSQRYIKDSINGISDFDSSSTVLNSKYGEITSLAESGYILKVTQDIKSTSIYIGRTVLSGADGAQGFVGVSDNLIGTIMPSQLDYGAVFPLSVVTKGTHQYFFDVFNGVVIRDSYNGPFPISDYGMSSYFKMKSKQMLDEGLENCDVILGWDGMFDELNVTIKIGDDIETVVFHEKTNKWSHFVTYKPERYMWFGDVMLSYKNNKLWLHGVGDPNHFYGENEKSEVEVIFNAEPMFNKIYKNIQIKGSLGWEGSAELEDMGAEIYQNDFKLKQDMYWANFRRNMTNGSMYGVNGSRLRGRLLRVKLEHESGELNYIVVNSIVSQLS